VSTGNIRQIVPVGVYRVGTAVPGSDGDGIGVAVLDTGIDINQPDLALAPESFSAFGGSAQDDRGHGTHVAGIIAALDNNRGVVGVAPGARLYAVKVLDATGSGDESQVIAGLDWVFVNRDNFSPPIRVVNMSLGRALEPGESIDDTGFPMRQEIQALYNEGIVVVVSAGNDYTLEAIDQVPAAFPEVLAVAGSVAESGGNDAICSPFAPLVSADSASYFTSDGAFVGSAGVTISAPSEERQDVFSPDGGFSCVVAIHGIRSTQLIQDPSSLGPNTVISSRLTPSGEAIGTSFAAPHVSGVVARIMQMGLVTATGDLEVEGIRNWIRANADRRDSAPVEPLGLVPAPLDQPLNPGYSFDGEREGIVQAPYPTQ
jgi:subtilisin family serine protease